MPKAPAQPPTIERVRELFDYSPKTGVLRWKLNRSGGVKAGDKAGSVTKRRQVLVGVDGRLYTAARVIYLWCTGVWPAERLRLRDEDPLNLRWDNITTQRGRYSRRKSATYARELRWTNREALAVIRASPGLYRDFLTADAKQARRILADARRTVRQADPVWQQKCDERARRRVKGY